MHKTTDNDQMAKMDKMGEAAQTMSGTTQNSAYTAIDYALKTQEMNTKLLQQSSQAWIEGFRYQAKLSQSMAQVFFGQWGNALAGMTHVALPVQRQSNSEVSEPATKDTQKATEPAAKDDQNNTEIAAKDDDAQKKAEKRAETQQAEKVAKDTQQTEKAAEHTQKATETAARSAQKNNTELAAEETQKSTEIAAKDAQKNTETATFPIEGYDEMNVEEVSERLDGLSVDELKRVRKYEKANKGRGSLRKEMKQKIKTQGDVAEDKSTS